MLFLGKMIRHLGVDQDGRRGHFKDLYGHAKVGKRSAPSRARTV